MPATLAPQAAYGTERRTGWRVYGHLAGIAKNSPAGPIRIARHRSGHRPARLHLTCRNLAERGADRLSNVQQFLRNQTLDAVIAAHDRVSQAFGERYCDLV